MAEGKPGAKTDREALRRGMLDAGCPVELIAGEMVRRWGFRPRAAFRLAHGWTQDELAAQLSQVVRGRELNGRTDSDNMGAAPVGAQRIGEYERWPFGGRRPSVYMLTVLAATLGTSVDHLLDGPDHQAMPDTDRVLLTALRRMAVDRTTNPSDRRPADDEVAYRDRAPASQ